jgi:hypothetical protein
LKIAQELWASRYENIWFNRDFESNSSDPETNPPDLQLEVPY